MDEEGAVRILALDIATSTGFALLDANGNVTSGVQKFELGRGDSPGMRFLNFRSWLDRVWFAGDPEPSKREELAWAAGFFDGEGCTTNHKAYTKTHVAKDGSKSTLTSDSIKLQVPQVERCNLERFMWAIGGVGAIHGPYQPKNRPNASPIYRWSCTGVNDARSVLGSMWPWLGRVKREQAERALGEKLSGMKRMTHLQETGLIAYEMPHARGGSATQVLMGFVAVVHEFCAMHGVSHSSVHTATLKKHATGKGNAGKPDMISAALRRWPSRLAVHDQIGGNALGDDEADALCILAWACDELGVKP